jgi:hypothetical protein
MFEPILMQIASGVQEEITSTASSSDSLAVLIGLLVTILPTISLVMRNYYNGQLKHKGEELIEAGKKVGNQEKVINDFTPILTKLIIANNDGRISQEEYNVIVSEAESKLVLYSKESGIDLAGLITSLRLLMEKSPPVAGGGGNGKGTLVSLREELTDVTGEGEVVRGNGARSATAVSMTKKR